MTGLGLWALGLLRRFAGPLIILTMIVLVILIAVFLQGEPASWPRLGLLTLACAIIGVSGTL